MADRQSGEKGNNGLGWLVAVGVVGFMLGRATAGSDAPPEPKPEAFSAFANLPENAKVASPASPVPAQAVEPQPVYEPAPVANTYYANCSEARAAGAAPVRIGDPGYAPHLDRDNDGVGCE